jgi:hypothetical protein
MNKKDTSEKEWVEMKLCILNVTLGLLADRGWVKTNNVPEILKEIANDYQFEIDKNLKTLEE